MLGNHRVSLATNLVLDLRNADYLLGYESREGRTTYAVQGFHLARELNDFQNQTVYRYRNYGLAATARYPLSKFRRVDAEVGLLGVSLTDLSSLIARPRSRLFLVPRLTYTTDATVPGFLGPRSGARVAASLSGSPGPDANFATALVDARRYWTLGPGYALALRGSAGLSLGPDPQRFYAAGVQNWLNASFRSLPVEGADDFVFATPVLPLRGFGFNEAAGDRFALVNAEARMPLVAALLPGPFPFVALYNLQAVAFVDAGVIADGRLSPWRTPTDPETSEALPRVLDDVLVGTGVGLRTILLGYPIRADWSWPYDGRRFGSARTYLSVGLDF
jgi:outer membrane protein assembly factor BamA